jgi:hypothetical protein
MSVQMKNFFYKLICLPFVILGAMALCYGTIVIIRAKASTHWPTVQGKVIFASMRTDSGGDNTTYHADIQYDFCVDGVTFTGKRVAYGDYGSSDTQHAERVLSRYPVGTKVAVYYMPDRPEECLLEPGLRFQSLSIMGFGLLFFAVGYRAIVILHTEGKSKSQNKAVGKR